MSGVNSWAHRRPAFLPWYREFLRRFELDLQAIDPSVSLPYCEGTVDNSPTSSIWSADFMEGNGRASDGPGLKWSQKTGQGISSKLPNP